MAAGILLCPVCRPCCFYLSVSPCLWICPSGLNIHLVPEGDVLYWFWGNALQDIFSSIGGSLLFHTLICLNWTGWGRAPFNEYFVLLFVFVFYRFWQSTPIWHFWVSPSCCIPHMPDACQCITRRRRSGLVEVRVFKLLRASWEFLIGFRWRAINSLLYAILRHEAINRCP